MSRYSELRYHQSGVVSRRQLLGECGLAPHDVRRLVRRRELVELHRGVYVDHTGEPSWLQRAWGGVLALWPAALSHESALRADDGPGRSSDRRIHVAVDRHRSPAAPVGVRMHHVGDLDAKVRWNDTPPRVRLEEVVVDLAAGAPDDHAAVAMLSDAVRARRTTAARLLDTIDARVRLARRDFLSSVLCDVRDGTCSVLEHAYLDRVERAHGLPYARRQVLATSPGRLYRDVEYHDHAVLVELDGRTFHEAPAQRDGDLDRDLDALVSGRVTLRLGWGQVVGRPCATAARVGAVLQARGWGSPVRRCGPGCTAAPYLDATG